MRTKIIAALLAVLTALGGLNLFQSIKKKILPAESEVIVMSESRQERVQTKTRSKVIARVRVNTNSDEVMIEESFNVDRGDELIVNISHADVTILTGSGTRAEIEVTLDSKNMRAAKERFEDMDWRVYKEGDAIHIEADQLRGNWNTNIDIDVLISIPTTFDIDLETSHGDVELGDLTGSLRLLTSHGDVEMGEVAGSAIWIKSSHGDIEAVQLRSDQVEVQTSHADIEVGAIYSKRFDASTSHADVEIDYLEGESSISTSHGDISVHLNGDSPASFVTQHGDVDLYVDSDIEADFDLRAADVNMSRSLRLNDRVDDDRVEGSVNGGVEPSRRARRTDRFLYAPTKAYNICLGNGRCPPGAAHFYVKRLSRSKSN